MADDFLHQNERMYQRACRECHELDCDNCTADTTVTFSEAAGRAVENARQRMEEYRRGR